MLLGLEKKSLRRAVADGRRALSADAWRAEDQQRTSRLMAALGDVPKTVALYASRPGEPATTEAITALHAAGWHVLLPTVTGMPGWATFTGWDMMRPGWGGIPQPLAPEAVSIDSADIVVAACLAVAQDGTRLGTGGGWYDRALGQRRHGTPVWALARTQELLLRLPREDHDVPVDAAITQDGVHPCGDTGARGIGKPWLRELS